MSNEKKQNDDLIKDILALEWEMFQQVQNHGGQAPCQKDQKTFLIMRLSQVMAWTEPMLRSYRKDLLGAKAQGRNLMTEKYAHMMKYTAPEEYNGLFHKLPTISKEAEAMVNGITLMIIGWANSLKESYPKLAHGGRPIEKSGDTKYVTSLETYTKGELLTYSEGTLHICWDYFMGCLAKGQNYHEEVLRNTVRLYGFESLEAAESQQ